MTTPASLLYPDAFLSPLAIDEAVHRALDEDLGRAGDITSMATIPEATHAHAVMVARQSGVIAGLPLAVAVFQDRDFAFAAFQQAPDVFLVGKDDQQGHSYCKDPVRVVIVVENN